MASFNKIILMGNLAAKPDLRYTKSNKEVCNLVVAVNDYSTNDVDYLPVVAWGKLAVSCNDKLKKGSAVLVEGTLKKRSYEYKGEKRSKMEIHAMKINFISNLKK